MKLCMYNDCKCGDGKHEYSICCCDCPNKDDCPERCVCNKCDSCYWMIEVKDESRSVEM
jgi:hypothetical protein